MNPTTRKEFEGLSQYPAIVTAEGKQIGPEFSDWFANDEAAQAGFREIMEAQGYTVRAVIISSISEVQI